MRNLRKNRTARSIAAFLLIGMLALLSAMPAAAAPLNEDLPPPPPFSMQGDVYAIGGVTSHVDRSQLDLVPPHCVNNLGMGSQEFLSQKCGVYLAERGEVTPKEVADSKGSIEYYNELNHYGLPFEGPAKIALNEGAFTWLSLGYVDSLRVRVDRPDIGIFRDLYIKVAGAPLNNTHILIRGLYKDGNTPADRNTNIVLSGYEAGHVEVQHLPRGAWASEGTEMQKIATSMAGSNNCGAEGCPRLTLIMIDLNTEATTVIYFTKDGAGKLHSTLAWSNM